MQTVTTSREARQQELEQRITELEALEAEQRQGLLRLEQYALTSFYLALTPFLHTRFKVLHVDVFPTQQVDEKAEYLRSPFRELLSPYCAWAYHTLRRGPVCA